uniref:Transposase n=1 Tax=Strongyloides venezuelensis TaxID=75913 RepID=A0A0K0FJV1_STRVS
MPKYVESVNDYTNRIANARKRKSKLLDNIPEITEKKASMIGPSEIACHSKERCGKKNTHVLFKKHTITPTAQVIQKVNRLILARATCEAI